MKKDYREIAVVCLLFVAAVFLVLRSVYFLKIKVPCYFSCYSQLRIPLPFLTNLLFLSRHWLKGYFAAFLGISLSVVFASVLIVLLFSKKKIVPGIIYAGSVMVLLFFIFLSNKAMELPLNKLERMKNKRFSPAELSRVKKCIESGRCPFQSRF